MPTIGLPELIVIGMILVLVFGASRLPKIGEGLGRTVRNLKRGFQEDERIEIRPSGDGAPKPIAKGDTPAASPGPSAAGSSAVTADEPTDAEIIEETKRS